jgi:cytochrome c biogenesis protein CcdA
MTGIGYLAAFLGGVLTLLSPCSALLLPAFFAYAVASRSRLLGRTAVFYADLAGVLVPLGMGSSAASTLVYGHQAALTTTAGVLLIGFGILQVVGGGFTVPGLAHLRARVRGQSALSVLALGAVSGLAGFCAGPILGAVLTVAGRLRSAIARRGAADGLRRGDDRAAVRAGCRLGPAGR